MHDILFANYNIHASSIVKLSGYDNLNYLVKTAEAKYILKTYPFSKELYDLLVAESELLDHLSSGYSTEYPKPVKSISGDLVFVESVNGEKTLFRMLTWLEGTFFSESLHTPELFMSFGAFLARLDKSLLSFDSYVYRARQYDWDIQHLQLCEPYASHIADPSKRKQVDYFILQFKDNVIPQLPLLRKSIIHNDANDWNVLVNGDDVVSIIDFGDTVYAPLINELAMAITYAVMGKADPLSWATHIIKGYHKILALERREVELLYYLIAARLCLSVCQSAIGRHRDPENSYVSISENAAWELLHLWLTIDPERARRVFGSAIGLEMYPDESIQEKVDKRHKYINPIVSISYKEPIWMTKAAFQYMYDGYGNTFLDAYNNIPHVGHSHPKVVEAGRHQMAALNTNTRYVYDSLAEYSERLLSLFPKPLSKVYFVNSGSAASDLAIRLARHYTGREAVMVMEHGYHGHTCTGVDISHYKFSNQKGPGRKPYILSVPMPDTYRGAYRDADAGQKYAYDALGLLNSFQEPVAAFIAEPVVGCGGQVPLANGYLQSLYPVLRQQGAVCISDEVQTGFGRLGEHFWGFEAHGVVPDIVVLGKPMGNGHPMGAVVTTEAIADSFEKGVEFFSSFGGNPVSCAIGMAVLDVIAQEKLQRNALEVGNYYKQLMTELSTEFPSVGDVRGSGLFLGFEMILENGGHDTQLAAHIKNELRKRNILISTDGPYDNVLKSKPPLCFTKQNAEQVVNEIYSILKENAGDGIG